MDDHPPQFVCTSKYLHHTPSTLSRWCRARSGWPSRLEKAVLGALSLWLSACCLSCPAAVADTFLVRAVLQPGHIAHDTQL